MDRSQVVINYLLNCKSIFEYNGIFNISSFPASGGCCQMWSVNELSSNLIFSAFQMAISKQNRTPYTVHSYIYKHDFTYGRWNISLYLTSLMG